GASNRRRYQTTSPGISPIPESCDSAQNGTTMWRSKAGREPAPNSHSPFRLIQSGRRSLGRGYSGLGPSPLIKFAPPLPAALGRFIVGAEHEARRQAYGVLLTSIDAEVSGTEYALPALMERRVDGILLAAPQMEDDRAVAHVLDKTLPVVSLYHVPGGGVATVGSDHVRTGFL